MTGSTPPPTEGARVPSQPTGQPMYGSTGWAAAAPGPGQAPGWGAPATAWTPPGAVPPPAAESPRRSGTVVLVLVALAGLLVGAVGAGLVMSAVFLASARDMGEEMADGVGEEIVSSLEESLAESMEGFGGALMPAATVGSGGPVEQFPPVEPGELGPDPVLDVYAQNCFGGDLQACDDLYYESPPMSGYEDYGSTCGGRVKPLTVYACTELD
jgi:hypothetical protein